MPATKPKPRTKPAEIRRSELMAAAETIFLEKGFAATSVDEIVRKADVAKGTFYLHFRSKDDMLIALRDQFVNSYCETLDKKLDAVPVGDWNGRLATWAATGVAGYLDNYRLHDLVFYDFHPPMRHVKQENPAILRLETLLSEGKAAGAWKIENSRLLATLLFHALHGAVDDFIIRSDIVERAEMVRGVQDLFLKSVKF
ncbi:TetR/AcrR family transcriptional regulator [Brucella rhizosphaerae]|uniref:Bacterial regulatory, tetR family protein n=2 Tax=Brucella rhizosphaerae TaxID=571254 RepID=A0A256F5J3_9HYPH|nr:TetR/AcrR family transcriptional regulator [Brucella rhizosphaerae]OYR09966.1 bacterial regulatory, tetR family protein [Brucella rhizosphaerae]